MQIAVNLQTIRHIKLTLKAKCCANIKKIKVTSMSVCVRLNASLHPISDVHFAYLWDGLQLSSLRRIRVARNFVFSAYRLGRSTG